MTWGAVALAALSWPWWAHAASGESAYATRCAVCHQPAGEGIPGIYPPLAATLGPFARGADGRAYLIRVVTFGMVGPIRSRGATYNGLMPSHPGLSDEEVAELLNFILRAFNAGELPPDFQPFTAEEVAEVRAMPRSPAAVREERARVLAAPGPAHEEAR